MQTLLLVVVLVIAAVACGAVIWLAMRLRERSRVQRLAEARLASVEEAVSDALMRVDADGAITAWSPAAATLYGYERDEIVGRPLAELCADPEDVDRIAETLSGDVIDQRRSDGSVFAASVTAIHSAEEPEAIVVARDIHELQRTQSELGNTEAKYDSLVRHLPVVTYIRSVNGDRDFKAISPQIDALAGYTASEWLADPDLFLRLVHPEDRDRVAADHAAVDAAKSLRTSYRLVARDGRSVWIREEATAVLDGSGRPLCIQGYLQDVSERKSAEETQKELRAAEAVTSAEARARQRKLNVIAEAASVLASSVDVRANVEEVAVLATRELADWCVVDLLIEDGSLTRYVAEGAESSTSSPAPEAHPESSVMDAIKERRPEVTESQLLVPLVSPGRRAIGALTLVNGGQAAAYRADDLPWARALAGMIALAVDNSRLHAEVKARSDENRALTHVGEGVFLLDRAGVVLLWNPASAAITGVSTDAAVGKAVAEVIPGWQELSERIPLGRPPEPVGAEALPLDTSRGERWISIAGAEFFGGTVYAFRDITEEHRLEELKAEFIATASHELRTPLAAVYGAAQTLRRHDFALDDAGRERFISLIVDESNRLAAIVNEILLANQLDMGRLDLVTEPFDGADLLERVAESARSHAPDHVTFAVQVDADVPLVAADKDRARQVLVNLVENAVKYSPGGGRIELGIDGSNGSVRFRVADEGMGIPDEEQRRIFEKFYRLDPHMVQGIGGTGLGLYICRELVERMGGRIWLESEEGKGSTFYFELPSSSSHYALGAA